MMSLCFSQKAFSCALLRVTSVSGAVSYTHLRAHETSQDLVCRDGIRDPEMSRGLGDVYKRQVTPSS
ncbi:hypothetical protein ACX3V1_23780 [Escherichia coli]